MPRVLLAMPMMRSVPSLVMPTQPALVPVAEVLVITPVRRNSELVAMDQYFAAGAMTRSPATMFVPASLVKMPDVDGFKVSRLPLSTKPSLTKRIEPTVRLPMSLVLFSRVAPEKIKLSLLTGAVPPQLALVLQLLSPPPPVHVLSAP